ncbi:hypothetical protein CVT26_006595 [Gymnopilus dilepis]|uniref:Uncharacterized protein n=1 Tax=Gymnopilus dilepis TaxID=231916 RepID=A0A409Y329_9AGAR|nr:hypothetical protein CVT26_006595 [Gymnopilus dilepis]
MVKINFSSFLWLALVCGVLSNPVPQQAENGKNPYLEVLGLHRRDVQQLSAEEAGIWAWVISWAAMVSMMNGPQFNTVLKREKQQLSEEESSILDSLGLGNILGGLLKREVEKANAKEEGVLGGLLGGLPIVGPLLGGLLRRELEDASKEGDGIFGGLFDNLFNGGRSSSGDNHGVLLRRALEDMSEEEAGILGGLLGGLLGGGGSDDAGDDGDVPEMLEREFVGRQDDGDFLENEALD